MILVARLKRSLLPAAIHFFGGLIVVCAIAMVLFFVWYPWPYDEFSGGRSLFLMLIGVDVVCGPLLTLLLVTETKPRRLLVLDISLVLLIQGSAMAYGLYVAWQARPIYMVAEIDRFKIITNGELKPSEIQKLPSELRTGFWKKPIIVGIRPPTSIEEKNKVLFESLQGGRDYAERPEFYIPYRDDSAKKSLNAGRNLSNFVRKHPELQRWANEYAANRSSNIDDVKYLPIMAREDWIAILDVNGYVADFLKGEGF